MTVLNLVDAIHADVNHLPRDLAAVAGYTTGTPDIRWTAQDWERFLGHKVRIDQSDGLNPLSGLVKDIERGAATIPVAVEWAVERRSLKLISVFYISASNLVECERAVAAAGLSDWVFYWIADWSLTRTEAADNLRGRVVAIQYASPSSNPRTLIPGTRLTLAGANADLSVVLVGSVLFPLSKEPRKLHLGGKLRKVPGGIIRVPGKIVRRVHPKVKAAIPGGGSGVGLASLLTHYGVHLTTTESAAIGAAVAIIFAILKGSNAA